MDSVTAIIVLFMIAFASEFVDSSLGMGYGTTLTPLLLIMGYSPLVVVPAILTSELITGGLAAFLHHREGNVVFDFRNDPNHRLIKQFRLLGYMPRSNSSKIALVLALCSLVGAVIAVFVAVNIPRTYLQVFIGLMVFSMGILILLKRNSKPFFSWKKIVGLGVLAAFNKGLSGGGYGPLVTSGQILSGVNTKSSVAITSLAESFTCFVGVCTFLLVGAKFDWNITLPLLAGAVASVPLSTKVVKKMKVKRFTVIVGTATVVLGLFTLYKVIY
ncbi:MAG: sulfite exporter TauE/SafE family protein [Candidatus Fermentibacteraceae bacterium]|nr:sulfite exporter TauE/SafE family protein [Candidatus Fermentibacteraceae bacterium]